MFTTNNGGVPGTNTSIESEAGTADGQVNNPQNATNFNEDSRSHWAIQQVHDGKPFITWLTAYYEAHRLTLVTLLVSLGVQAAVVASVLYGFIVRATL